MPSTCKTAALSGPALLLAAAALALSACGDDGPAEVEGGEAAPYATDTNVPAGAGEDETARDDDALPAGNGYDGSYGSASEGMPESAMLDGDLAAMEPSEGDWFEISGGRAAFGPPQSEARFILACESDGTIRLTRSGELANGEQLRAAIFTAAGTMTGSWRTAGEAMPTISMSLPADNEVFDDISASTRFAVGAEGLETLIMPVDTILTERIDTCRS